MNGSGSTGTGGLGVSLTVKPSRGGGVGESGITLHSLARMPWREVGVSLPSGSLWRGM
jgi:hypothetical protein